jgi:hypothetical protein
MFKEGLTIRTVFEGFAGNIGVSSLSKRTIPSAKFLEKASKLQFQKE